MSRCLASLLTGFVVTGAVAPAAAQLRASRPARPTQNLPRVMVANPHSFAAPDSAAAVRVGSGIRDRIETLADKWYSAIQRNQMNEALVQYGYPADAVLPPMVARQLAAQLQARALVSATLARGEGGRVTVEARLTGISDQTGHMVKLTQGANQSFEDFGAKVADSLKGAFNALPDAKTCESLVATNPAKAIEAGEKALKAQPNHGLAEMCLANVAKAQKKGLDEVVVHLANAAKGDRLSLEPLAAMLSIYQAKKDTAKISDTFAEMLRVAPTNQKLREEAGKWFNTTGRPERAEQIAREALVLDPSNPELLDLLSNACLVQGKPEKNKCAIDALEQVFALDSTKADTLFFIKMTFAAKQEPVDTGRYLKWALVGNGKYPKNGYLLSIRCSSSP